MSNALAALGGIAAGLSQGLQRKQDQQREDWQKHQDLINNLVVSGITSGKVTDPEQAFKFLMNSGKPGGKDLPPAITTMIGSVLQHAKGAQAAQPDTTMPPLPIQPGQQYDPSKDPNASRYSVTGSAPTAPAPPSPSTSSATGTGEETGDEQASAGTPSASPIPAGASEPAPSLVPGRSSNPMGGFKTADEMAAEETRRKAADMSATATAGINAKVAAARRMFATGAAQSLSEAYELVGLRRPITTGARPQPLADHIPVEAVPAGALTISGEPFDTSISKYARAVSIQSGYDTQGNLKWETRYEPSGPPAGVATASAKAATPQDPAKFRERVTEIKSANPGISDEDAKKKAGESLQAEAATAAGLAATRAQAAAEAAGTAKGPYDDMPTVSQGTDGRPDPKEQTQFLETLKAKPKGDILANNVKQAASYKMPSSDFTSRQIGGLNRATFVGLVTKYDPTFDEAKYKPRQEMATSWQGDGKTAQTMQSARKIINHLGDLQKASQEMDAVTSNMAGGVLNPAIAGAKRVGLQGQKEAAKAQQAVTDYKTAQNILGLELRRFFAVAGGGSQQELDDWEKLANPYGTTTERQTFLKTAAKMMLGQVVPKVEAYTQVMGDTPPGALWLTNQDRLRLRAMGVDTSSLPNSAEANRTPNPAEAGLPPEIQGLAPGMKATLPDGRVFYRDADGTLRGGTTVPPKKK